MHHRSMDFEPSILKFDEGAPGTNELFKNLYSSRSYIFIEISYLMPHCVLAGTKK
jgi:hypothetical protein